MLLKTWPFPPKTCLSLAWSPGNSLWKAPPVIHMYSHFAGGSLPPTLQPALHRLTDPACVLLKSGGILSLECGSAPPTCLPRGWLRSSTPQGEPPSLSYPIPSPGILLRHGWILMETRGHQIFIPGAVTEVIRKHSTGVSQGNPDSTAWRRGQRSRPH